MSSKGEHSGCDGFKIVVRVSVIMVRYTGIRRRKGCSRSRAPVNPVEESRYCVFSSSYSIFVSVVVIYVTTVSHSAATILRIGTPSVCGLKEMDDMLS